VKLMIIAAFAGLLVPAGATALPAAAATTAACTAGGAAPTRAAICRNAGLRGADTKMAAAFETLLAASSPADRAVFEDSQRAWLDDRDTDCDADTDGTPAKPGSLVTCLAGEDAERTRFLAGQPEAGPGTPDRIVPVMREGHGFIWSFRFADPRTAAEKLVDDRLDGEIAALHIGKTADVDDYSDNFDAELNYASADFLSASVVGDHLAPTPDKAVLTFDYNLNVDMRSGRLLGFSDAFPATALTGLQQKCAVELHDYLEPGPGQTAADAKAAKDQLDAYVANLDKWSFGATEARINLDPGDEDPYVCHLSYETLRPLAKAGFPLPAVAGPSPHPR